MTIAGFLVMLLAGRPGADTPATVLWLDCGATVSPVGPGSTPSAEACRIRSFRITTSGVAEVSDWAGSSNGSSDEALFSTLAGLVRP